MPIKSLESYLFERKLVNTSSIDVLQNATVGIDVEHYLSRIYTFKKEQFLAGIGGIPSSLKDYIQSDLQVFNEFNIKPVFIIPGLKLQLQVSDFQTNELTPQEQQLDNTWTKLNSKNNSPYTYSNYNNELFRLFTDPLPISPMINDLIQLFIANDIEYLISPYDSLFQLSYLYQSRAIDMIYGSTDLLLTQIDKFILGMEFQSKDFRFVDKTKVLTELSLSERQFTDLSIMVGCNVQPHTFPNFPPLPKPNPLQPYPQLSYFKIGLDIVYQYQQFSGASDLLGYVASLNDPVLYDLYLKAHSALKYIPVLNQDGEVLLYAQELHKLGLGAKVDALTEADQASLTDKQKQMAVRIPNNIHDFISQRLPPEFYFYQLIGIVPLDLLNAITQGKLNVRPPLESGLSDGYKNLITSPYYLRVIDKQFNLLTQLLARYYQVKKVQVKFWFKEEPEQLNNRITPPVFQQVNQLYVKKGAATFSLKLLLANVDEASTSLKGDEQIVKQGDVVATVVLRALKLLEILTDKGLLSVGRILKRFVAEHDVKEDVLEKLILLLLLIESGTLKLNQTNRFYPSVPKAFKHAEADSQLSTDDASKIALISRVFSLLKFNIHPINYQGPISRALLNFRSYVKFIQQNLINTIEATLIDFLARNDHNNIKLAYTKKSEWHALVKALPFFKDLNNTLLGVVSEIYFEYAVKQQKTYGLAKAKVISETKEHLLTTVFQINNSSFNINVNGINSIKSQQFLDDFKGGWELWTLFVELVRVANKEDAKVVSDGYLKEIEEAYEWSKDFYEA